MLGKHHTNQLRYSSRLLSFLSVLGMGLRDLLFLVSGKLSTSEAYLLVR